MSAQADELAQFRLGDVPDQLAQPCGERPADLELRCRACGQLIAQAWTALPLSRPRVMARLRCSRCRRG